MQIREFDQNDQPQVKEFVVHILQEFGFAPNPKLDIDLDNIHETYIAYGGMFYVLENEGKIIGTIAIKNKENGIGEIKRFYIDKNLRGKGYGSMLFEKILSFAKARGFTKIELDTWKRFTSAFNIYQHRGFTIIKREGEQIFMEKKL